MMLGKAGRAGRIGREGRRLALALSLAYVASSWVPVQAHDAFVDRTPGDQYLVDHNGIYLAQRIGQCMNGSGPCYFGGQCPGGEYTTNAYALPHIYCRHFLPKKPYPPTFFESLFTGRW
jgi:hypothetical protein